MRFSSILPVIVGLGASAPALAQTQAREAGTIVFKFVGDEIAAGGTKVFRGIEADPQYWRNVIVADFGTLTKNDNYCTATLVGDEAVLTSAHCMMDANGKLRPAVVEIAGKDWTLACMVSPKAAQDASFDYALCRLKKPPNAAPLPTDLYFDSVDTSPIAKDAPILLVGYGCETMSVDANGKIVPGPRTRAFRIGDETIADRAYPGSPGLLIETKGDQPALCQNDSGGPLISGATTRHQDAKRSIRGVNFSVNAGTGAVKFRSTAIALSDPAFRELLDAWRKANPGALVCEIGASGPPPGQCL